MKKLLVLFVMLSASYAFSQEKTFEGEVKKISDKIALITKIQKDSLKAKVEAINGQLDDKKITEEKATELKNEAAAYHAKQIELLVSVEEQKLQQLVQDKTNGKIASMDDKDIVYKKNESDSFRIGNKIFTVRKSGTADDDVDFRFWDKDERDARNERKSNFRRNRRTTSQFVFALGVNNVLVDNQLSSLDNSDYKFWQSHFYELGWTWKTRMSKDASKLYFKYGFSFLWNNLRANENRYHVVNGDVTNLVVHPDVLGESRLRNMQLTFPMHFEFDFSENGEYSDGTTRDRTNQSVRLGVGGFFGFKLGTKQFIEYRNTNGTRIEEVQKDDFNASTLNYGVSTYIAWRAIGLYMKYDLNPLFTDSQTRNLSLGLRFDIN